MFGVTIQIVSPSPKPEFNSKGKAIAEILEKTGFSNVVTSPAVIVYQHNIGARLIVDPMQIIITTDTLIESTHLPTLFSVFSQVAGILLYDTASIFTVSVNCREKRSEFRNLQPFDNLPFELPQDSFDHLLGTGYRILLKNLNVENGFDELKVEPFLRMPEDIYFEMNTCNRLSNIGVSFAQDIIDLFERRIRAIDAKLK